MLFKWVVFVDIPNKTAQLAEILWVIKPLGFGYLRVKFGVLGAFIPRFMGHLDMLQSSD